MTSIELGLIGFILVVCGLSLVEQPTGINSLWWRSTLVVTSLGAWLAYTPGNWSVWSGSNGLSADLTYTATVLTGGVVQADFKFLICALVAMASVGYVHQRQARVEPLVIGLIAVVAGLLTLQFDHLVVLYLGLELQALGLYTLVGYYKFDEERTDVAVRYLLSGSLVSGFTLLGFARGYHLSGTFSPSEFVGVDQLGSAWVVGALLFKTGTVPFHFWSPAVYTPLDWGTLAVTLGATKVNIWYLAVTHLNDQVHQVWWPLWWCALGSVLVGSVGGYFQTGVASLLAYSGVINGGYLWWLWLGRSVHEGSFSFGYYGSVYFLSTGAVLMFLSVFGGTRLTRFAGWASLGLGFPLGLYYLTLNLGGLPVFPGFFGKLILLKGLAPLGLVIMVFVVASSMVPAVYYVSIGGAALFVEGRQGHLTEWHPALAAGVTLSLAGFVVGLATIITGVV